MSKTYFIGDLPYGHKGITDNFRSVHIILGSMTIYYWPNFRLIIVSLYMAYRKSMGCGALTVKAIHKDVREN